MHFGWVPAILLVFPLSFASAENLRQYDGNFRLAKEIELKTIRLQRLMRFYDPDGTALTPSMVDVYLDEPDNLAALPEELRAQLIAGIESDLKASHLVLPPEKKILAADGTPARPASTTMNLSQAPSQSPTEIVGSARGRTQLAWETLRERWRALPFDTKRKAVRLSHIDPLSKALIASKDYGDAHLTLRTEGPSPILEVLKGMEFEPLTQAVEIKDKGTNSWPEEFIRDLKIFGEAAGITNYLQDPLGHHDGEASYHIHISTWDPTRDLTSVLKGMNYLYLLRFLKMGEGESMFNGSYGFKNSLASRGILRQITRNHFEIRTHLSSPEKELAEVLRWLSLPEVEALKEIYEEAKTLLQEKKSSPEILLQHPQGVIAAFSILSEGEKAGVDLFELEKFLVKNLPSTAQLFINPNSLEHLITLREVAKTHPRIWKTFLREVFSKIGAHSVSLWAQYSGLSYVLTQIEHIGGEDFLAARSDLVQALYDVHWKQYSKESIRNMNDATLYRSPRVGRLLRDKLRDSLKGDVLAQVATWGRPDETLKTLIELDREEPASRLWERIDAGVTDDIGQKLRPSFKTSFIQSLKGILDLATDPHTPQPWRPVLTRFLEHWNEKIFDSKWWVFNSRIIEGEAGIQSLLLLAQRLEQMGLPKLREAMAFWKMLPAAEPAPVCRRVPEAAAN